MCLMKQAIVFGVADEPLTPLRLLLRYGGTLPLRFVLGSRLDP